MKKTNKKKVKCVKYGELNMPINGLISGLRRGQEFIKDGNYEYGIADACKGTHILKATGLTYNPVDFCKDVLYDLYILERPNKAIEHIDLMIKTLRLCGDWYDYDEC